MKIMDLTTGEVFEYGSDKHHALRISGDGKTLSFEHLQNGDGSMNGNYRFIDDLDGKIPNETECYDFGADSYFNVGGFPNVEVHEHNFIVAHTSKPIYSHLTARPPYSIATLICTKCGARKNIEVRC